MELFPHRPDLVGVESVGEGPVEDRELEKVHGAREPLSLLPQ